MRIPERAKYTHHASELFIFYCTDSVIFNNHFTLNANYGKGFKKRVFSLPKKKVTIQEFVLKLRDYLIKVARKTRELEQSLTDILGRLDNVEKRLESIEKKLTSLEGSLSRPTPPSETSPLPPIETGDEFSDLAKELGLLENLKETPPEPPPVPPIDKTGTTEEKKTSIRGETRSPPSLVSALKRGEEISEEELKKEKDELVKVLEELELI